MTADRTPIWLAGAVIVLLTLATGPAVGFYSVPEPSTDALGSGLADVEILTVPDGAVLDGGSYTDVHYLDVPEVTAAVSNVSGSPILTASVDVEQLGYSRSSVFVLDDATRRQSFTIARAPIDSSEIQNASYQGRLLVVLRDDRGRTVLVDTPIRIEVTE